MTKINKKSCLPRCVSKMEVDLLLPLSVFAIITLSILFYERIQGKMKTLLEDRKFSLREVIFMVISMGVMVTVIALVPNYAVQILFIIVYSYTLLAFTYIVVGKWFLAFLPPIIFISTYLLTYLFIKDFLVIIIFMNIFTALFAIIVIVYLNFLFSWKITMIFGVLIMVMDIVQVFWTEHMIEAAYKMIGLQLPIALILPSFPSHEYRALGLGDIFLSGLLSAQTASKYGQKKGLITAATMSITFFIFEILMLNMKIGIQGFPATIIVLLGWLLGMGLIFLERTCASLQKET